VAWPDRSHGYLEGACRVTCYRVGMRLGQPELPALPVSHHRPGFYMRVITEGHIQAGDPIEKTRTGPGALCDR
jgi:MOSC domain-containing protein YiiM